MKKTQLIVAILTAVFAAVLIGGYLNNLENTYRRGARKVPVLVAKQYIDQGTMLTPEIVIEKMLPDQYLQPRALVSIKDLQDKGGNALYMTIVPVMEGEQILGTKLFSLGQDTGISAVVPSEKRALTMVMDRDAVYGIVKPGNRVDIIGIFEYSREEGSTQKAVTLLQNVMVLAVGKAVYGSIQDIKLKQKQLSSAVAAGDVESKLPVTLAVSPKEAELLALAYAEAKVVLALRPAGDDKLQEATSGTVMESLMGEKKLPGGAGPNKVQDSLAGQKKPAGPSAKYLQEIEKQQKEAMELLKKYQK